MDRPADRPAKGSFGHLPPEQRAALEAAHLKRRAEKAAHRAREASETAADVATPPPAPPKAKKHP